jgi:PPM family protein phosphatase
MSRRAIRRRRHGGTLRLTRSGRRYDLGAMTVRDVTRVAAASDRGRSRSRNEDAILAVAWRSAGASVPTLVLAVADGIGGSAGGDVASREAIAVVQRFLQPRVEAGGLVEREAWLDALRGAFDDAAGALRRMAADDPALARMGTTLTCAVIDRGRVLFGHIGDSRALLFRDGALRQLTTDHNAAADLVAEGRLAADDAGSHRSRFILTRWLPAPAGELDPPEIGELALAPGDLVMVCSDGLHALVPEAEIRAVLGATVPDEPGALDAAVASLVRLANERGGTDNISIALAGGQG